MIPGTLVSFDMVPVPGGSVRITGPDSPGDTMELAVGPFWMGKTEVTWDEYDVWMLGLDEDVAARGDIDAESRPSSPYGAPDHGFGHTGFAAISLSYHSAVQYAEWLSKKTDSSYRLPTAAEWEHACLLGISAGKIDAAYLGLHAWYGGNSSGATHPVASQAPNGLGLFDMLGNVSEWATPIAGEPALHGASYLDEATQITCGWVAEQTQAWNASDPQIPQSRWWLADAPFAGFRMVREPETGDPHE